MASDPVDALDDLAGQAAEEFKAYRQPDEFKDVSLVIDNNDPDRLTLIVHVDRENTDTLADDIEAFLQEQGARTQRERHSETDVRVLVHNRTVRRQVLWQTDTSPSVACPQTWDAVIPMSRLRSVRRVRVPGADRSRGRPARATACRRGRVPESGHRGGNE